ncbi:MAG: hypothetical protein R2705_07670 [Ilumatobacteraceae bacterium]
MIEDRLRPERRSIRSRPECCPRSVEPARRPRWPRASGSAAAAQLPPPDPGGAPGLVRLVEERPRRGLTERIVVASARSYAVSPDALGECGADPARADRLSTRYLVAVAARMIREVADRRRAEASGRTLPA